MTGLLHVRVICEIYCFVGQTYNNKYTIYIGDYATLSFGGSTGILLVFVLLSNLYFIYLWYFIFFIKNNQVTQAWLTFQLKLSN